MKNVKDIYLVMLHIICQRIKEITIHYNHLFVLEKVFAFFFFNYLFCFSYVSDSHL